MERDCESELSKLNIEQNYIPKIIARIPYTNPETKEVMKRVEEELIEYARIGLISSCP